ncbi:uncharacterized protein C8Q71DRAFT_571752 [Rhodofomes roseus]|uniref:Uncharacterized protein n=1 Tax=Rhodofomes roseus TaxID=34475 RepID=A0A4Y9Z3H7_9APHY|nr:uncharacterized protein C8Q71DRAFT_571752 [Rhodofomes roseus]KAH9837991.1 hypothetical protein C8Q71DRAFT_571752 [Rhodofomes roseus]TFY68423.1 hypothetical protein EVJ58_g1028 [Rhodofomes roseus]
MTSSTTTSSSEPSSPRKWPFNTARSTGTECMPLLAALLAASALDEISTSLHDFSDVEGFIRGRGRIDAEDRTLDASLFWVYPSSFWGPFRETEEGGVKQHGLLVTIERGAKVTEAMEAIKANFQQDGTAHVHIAAA